MGVTQASLIVEVHWMAVWVRDVYESGSDEEDADANVLSSAGIRVTNKTDASSRIDVGIRRKPAVATNPQVKGYVSKRKIYQEANSHDETTLVTAVDDSKLKKVREYLPWSEDGDIPAKKVRQSCEVPQVQRSTLSEHSKAVMGLCWNPSHRDLLISASLDGKIKLWDAVRHAKCIATYSHHTSGIRTADWIDGSKIVSGGYDKCCKCVDVVTGQTTLVLAHSGFVTAAKIAGTDRNMIITGDMEKHVQSWDLRAGKRISQFVGAGGGILSLEFLHNGKEFIATADIVRKNAYSQAVVVWDIASTAVMSNQVYTEPYTCPCLKVHPNEPYILAQSNGNYIVLFSSDRPYKMCRHKRYEGHTVEGFSIGLDVSSDGRLVCSGSSDGKVYFYDYYSSTVLKSFAQIKSSTLAVAIHPSLQSTVAVSNWSGTISILD